jgi:hypothetical protein
MTKRPQVMREMYNNGHTLKLGQIVMRDCREFKVVAICHERNPCYTLKEVVKVKEE